MSLRPLSIAWPFAVAAMTACTGTPSPTEPVAVATPHVEPPAAGARRWQPAWSGYVGAAIDRLAPDLLDEAQVPLGEISLFCPGFAHADAAGKKAFWVAFLAGIARFESTFDPSARAVEPFDDPETGRPEVCEGLLQLAYSDRLNHPDCHLDRKSGNLRDPEVNLSCGVAILRRQIAARGTLFPKTAYYWAVLTRPKQQRRVRDYLKLALAREPACRR